MNLILNTIIPRKTSLIHATIFSCTLFIVKCLAQTEEIYTTLSLEDLFNIQVTTASKISQKLSEAPSNISVVTALQIREWGCRDLQDVLRRMVDVPVILDRDEWVYAIRGNVADNNSKYLIMIDGHRMNSIENFGPGHIIERISNLSNVARIEVIRGPGSAVWGPDAMAGVINIITKNASDIYNKSYVFSVRGALGHDAPLTEESNKYPASWSADFQLGKKMSDDADIMFMGAAGASDGYDILQSRSSGFSKNLTIPDNVKKSIPNSSDTVTYPGQFITKLDKHNPGYMLQLKSHLAEFRLNALSYYSEYYNRQLEWGFGRENYLTTSKTFIEGAWEKEWVRAGKFMIKVSTDINREEYQPSGQDDSITIGQINITWLDRRFNANADYLKKFWDDKISFQVGFDIAYTIAGPNQRFNNLIDVPDSLKAISTGAHANTQAAFWFDPLLHDYQIGGYLQSTITPIEQLSVVLGLRGDGNLQRGSDPYNFNPRVAVMYLPNECTTIKGLYNRGYLRPTNFQSAFYQDSIRSETMDQYDLIWMQLLKPVSITIDVFHQTLHGFINLFPGNSYSFRNTGDYHSSGIELEAKVAINNHDIWANWYYTLAKVNNFAPAMAYNNRRVDLDSNLLTYPPMSINVGTTIRLLNNNLSLSPDIHMESPVTYRLASVTSQAADDPSFYGTSPWYFYLNMAALWDINDNVSITLYGYNITDNRQQKPQSIWNGTIGQPGAEGGLKLTLKL